MSDWIVRFIEDGGYFAVCVLMAIENIFPPLPSEVVLPMAGYLSSQGTLHPAILLIVATLGATIGNFFWYLVAYRFGTEGLKAFIERHGRWVAVSPEELDRAELWFKKHGKAAVFFGRFVPGLRTLISVPAGFTRMPLLIFFLTTTLATCIWNSLLLTLGYSLGENFESAGVWLGRMGNLVFAICTLLYIYRVSCSSLRKSKLSQR